MAFETFQSAGCGTSFISGGMAQLGSTAEAKNISFELSTKSNDLKEICTKIDEILNGLEQNWSTSQADQRHYVQKLAQNKTMLEKVAATSSKVSDVVSNYATKLEKISSNTVS